MSSESFWKGLHWRLVDRKTLHTRLKEGHKDCLQGLRDTLPFSGTDQGQLATATTNNCKTCTEVFQLKKEQHSENLVLRNKGAGAVVSPDPCRHMHVSDFLEPRKYSGVTSPYFDGFGNTYVQNLHRSILKKEQRSENQIPVQGCRQRFSYAHHCTCIGIVEQCLWASLH